jgi:hypothetical protein
MQQQITYEYNRTALPSNATSLNVLLLTWKWNVMQVKASTGSVLTTHVYSACRHEKVIATFIDQGFYYNIHVTAGWFIMLQLNCCGAIGPQDYRYSTWFNHTKSREGVFVPPTCCTLLNDDPDNPFVADEDGCQIDAILFPTDKRRSSALKTRVPTQFVP